jgi:hypothetical protein
MPEAPEEPDPMEQYYDKCAFDVADELFGDGWKLPGEFYSTLDGDIPYHIINSGHDIVADINMISGEPSGLRGLEGYVIPKSVAEQLVRSRVKGYVPPSTKDR